MLPFPFYCFWGLGSSGTVNRLRDSRKGFTDAIDTGTPSGRFFFHVMHSLTAMKRQMTDSKIESSKNLGVTVPTLYRWIPPSARS